MPYTFVLTPQTSHASKYIELSQGLYSEHQPQYLLKSDGTSAPHITVAQFECEHDMAIQVWNKMREYMQQMRLEPFEPPFTGVAFVNGTGPYTGTTWVELSIDRGLSTSPVMKVHDTAVESFGLNPLNASGNRYRPHLTLTRIALPQQLAMVPANFLENPGEFRLEFGRSDEKWQYAEQLGVFSLASHQEKVKQEQAV